MNVYLLGATGSIGMQTIEVIREFNLNLVAFSSGKNIIKTKEIIEELSPKFVSVKEKEDAMILQSLYPNVTFYHGDEGLIKIATLNNNDGVLVNALVGFVGMKPTIEAIKVKKKIALANKETLVVAGDIIMPLAKEYNVPIIPIDSEHSAILQCLNGEDVEKINKIIITASGGSFRTKSREELNDVTREDALNHPNWDMGAKITIDSATMMNKGFEVIEAHHLFGLPYNQIETILHDESIVHSMVEFVDGSIMAQLGSSDMRIPIYYALMYPNRLEAPYHMDVMKLNMLHFKEMDEERYPFIKLAYDVGKIGGVLPCVMNAANEAAVQLFLEGKISFLDIERIVTEAVDSFDNRFIFTVDDLIIIHNSVKNNILDFRG